MHCVTTFKKPDHYEYHGKPHPFIFTRMTCHVALMLQLPRILRRSHCPHAQDSTKFPHQLDCPRIMLTRLELILKVALLLHRDKLKLRLILKLDGHKMLFEAVIATFLVSLPSLIGIWLIVYYNCRNCSYSSQ